MAELKRHARLLYLLALFQLLGGPLVLGGLMLFSRLMMEQQLTLAEGVALTVQHMDGLSLTLDAEEADDWTWTQEHGLRPPAKSHSSKPAKLKEGKNKLWALDDLSIFSWVNPAPVQTQIRGRHDPIPPRLAHSPPLPPPRWM